MRVLVFILSIMFLSVSSAQAKIPTEVMEPYKAYRAALKAGDKDALKSAAKTAWKQAEKHMGAHKTTGDLAQNYADAINDIYSKDRRTAYQRSIELAHLHTNDAAEYQLVRQIKLAEMGFYFPNDGRKYFHRDVIAAIKLVKNGGFKDTIYDGEIKTLQAINTYKSRNINLAIRQIDAALEIFSKNPNDGSTIYPHIAKVFRADFLKYDKQDIAALIQYQSVMQNVENILPSDHPYVKNSFKKWISLRYDIIEDGRLAEAEAAGLCECWPFKDYKNKIVPLRRIPPKMPSKARRSGHVIVEYSVSDAGKITDVKEISSTSNVFTKPALTSVKKWVFSPKSEGEVDGARRNLIAKIKFKLFNRSGKLIPEQQ